MLKKIGYNLFRCSLYPLPQLYLFNGKGVPLKIHTDYNPDTPRDFGMIIYLHDYWNIDCGGILNLHSGKSVTDPEVKIAPLPNRMVIFRVSPISYHSLSESNPSWIRKTLVVDWDLNKADKDKTDNTRV